MDINKIIQQIIEKKSLFLVVVIVLVFLIIAIILFGDYSSKMENLKHQNGLNSQKNERIVIYKKAEKKLKDYLNSLPKQLTEDELVNQVEEYAVTNHINIVDVSSTDKQKFEYYNTIGVHMTFNVKNFQDLVSFLHAIEVSPYFLNIESWSGRAGELKDGFINCEIKVTAIQIKK